MLRKVSSPLLLAAVAVLAAGCEESVDPTLGVDVPFSLYGYLDPTADRQALRVVPIEDRIAPTADTIDAAVTSTDLGTGETHAWRDSLVTFADGSRGHVFVADFSPRPASRVRVEARRSDGAVSAVEVDVPVIARPAVAPPAFEPTGIVYPVRIEGVPRVLVGTLFLTIAGHPDDPPGVSRRLEIPTRSEPEETAPGVWSLDVPFVEATRAHLGFLGLLDTAIGLVDVEYQVFVSHAGWDPPSDDPDALVEPGTFSNVEAGLGFVGAGYPATVRWSIAPDVARAAGFPSADDPVSELVINEVLVEPDGSGGWVEFYNPSLSAVPLGGYTLGTGDGDPNRQRITAGTVIQPGEYKVVDLTFGLTGDETSGPRLVFRVYRSGMLVLQDYILQMVGFGSATTSYGSFPDTYSRPIRETISLEDHRWDLFRGALRPTPGQPNELGLDVAFVNEIYTEGARGWVETVTVRDGVDSLSVIYEEELPGASFLGASRVVPSGVGAFGVADERPPGLVLAQGGGTVFVLAYLTDPRVAPRSNLPNPRLDPTTQLRVVDARTFGGQTSGRSTGHLPDAPGGVWTPDLRPTRGTPNTLARLGL